MKNELADQFSKQVENAFKNALAQADAIAAEAEKIRKQAEQQLDAARDERQKAEREGEKMAAAYFEKTRVQLLESARTELLRQLVRTHLETGKTPIEIANWLHVDMPFIEKIKEIIDRNLIFNKEKQSRTFLENRPKLRVESSGRGGTVYFEDLETKFDLWWEFAGGDALVLVEVPTEKNWTARTRLPLEKRIAVLTFIGEELIETQNSGRGSFIIGENVLTIYGE